MTLSARSLNRTLLARQLLLARARLPIGRAFFAPAYPGEYASNLPKKSRSGGLTIERDIGTADDVIRILRGEGA